MKIVYALIISLFAGMCTLPAEAQERPRPAVRVIDGDTIMYGRTRVRLMGFDTGQITKGASGYKCEAERQLGLRAKQRLAELVIFSPVTLRWAKGQDNWGRSRGWLYIRGKEVGRTLIAEGLAKPYNGGERPSWC